MSYHSEPSEPTSRAEGSLFSYSVTSEHFDYDEIKERLVQLGYKGSINFMLRCGSETGHKIIRECPDCGASIINATYKCSSRICPRCGKIRQRRMKNKYLPILKSLPQNRGRDKLFFLTISPANYD